MFEIERILCPTDFSEASLEALSQASDLAIKFGAEIYLVHVVPIVPTLPNDPAFVFQYEQLLHAEAQKHLSEIAREVGEKGIRTRTFLLHGDPATVIVGVAEEQRISLIVIATFGKTGWRRLAFGSVTEKVVRLAPCPVLTVRGVEQPAAAD